MTSSQLIPCALLLTTLLTSAGDASKSNETDESTAAAIHAVSRTLSGIQRPFAIRATDLRALPNPYGRGTLVYHPQFTFEGKNRQLAWFVLDDWAYPLNFDSKELTPSLPWPRDVAESTWRDTGLDFPSTKKALAIVFPTTAH